MARPKERFCKNGHDKDILGCTKNGGCRQCKNEKAKARRIPHPKPKVQFCPRGHDTFICGRTKQKLCRDCSKERNTEFRNTHPEVMKQWREEHKNEIYQYAHEYWEKNKEQIKKNRKPETWRLNNIKNHAERKLRIPPWADWDKIKEFERKRPKGMAMDHIIPLQGKLVSGLHVSWNLQYLTISENAKKNKKCDLLKISEWYGQILEEIRLKS